MLGVCPPHRLEKGVLSERESLLVAVRQVADVHENPAPAAQTAQIGLRVFLGPTRRRTAQVAEEDARAKPRPVPQHAQHRRGAGGRGIFDQLGRPVFRRIPGEPPAQNVRVTGLEGLLDLFETDARGRGRVERDGEDVAHPRSLAIYL